jgi:hypothetical protein
MVQRRHAPRLVFEAREAVCSGDKCVRRISNGFLRGRAESAPPLMNNPGQCPESLVSESNPESELQHARLIREARILDWLSVTRVAFCRRVGAVVRMVEQVVGLEDGIR